MPPGRPRPPEEWVDVTLNWEVPLATRLPGGDYSLYLEKQPGTDGLCLGLSVSQRGTPAQVISGSGGSQDGAGRTCLTTDVRVSARFR